MASGYVGPNQSLDTGKFRQHIQNGRTSTNVEDRRGAPVVERSYGFDGKTVTLNVARHDGTLMSDDEAIQKYLKDGEFLTVADGWRPSASDPQVGRQQGVAAPQYQSPLLAPPVAPTFHSALLKT